jgi:hypothetical protein
MPAWLLSLAHLSRLNTEHSWEARHWSDIMRRCSSSPTDGRRSRIAIVRTASVSARPK